MYTLKSWAKAQFFIKLFDLVTVLCSNLRDLITPGLILQLNALKAHINIKSFKYFLS